MAIEDFRDWTGVKVQVGESVKLSNKSQVLLSPQIEGRLFLSVKLRANVDTHMLRMGTRLASRPGGLGGTTWAPYDVRGENECWFMTHFSEPYHITLSIDRYSPDDAELTLTNPMAYEPGILNMSPKNGYSNSKVQVSKEGMMRVDGKAFVPIGIQVDNRRSDYKAVAAMGFNLIMNTNSVAQVQRAKQAGMFCMFNLTGYIWDKNRWLYNDWPKLNEELSMILNSPNRSALIGGYVDMEAYKARAEAQRMVEIWRSYFSLPIYGLHGNYGMAPLWSQMNWMDLTGSYLRGAGSGGASPGAGGNFILQTHPNQHKPVTFTQVNNWNSFPYSQLIGGAGDTWRGLSHWGDGARGDVTETPWADDFPEFVKEFTQTVLEMDGSDWPEEPDLPEEPEEPEEPGDDLTTRIVARMERAEEDVEKIWIPTAEVDNQGWRLYIEREDGI